MRKLDPEEIAARRITKDEAGSAQRLPVAGMLDNIRSLYNVGSMFRTSDGAFARHLYLTGYTPSPPRVEIAKTALGAVETVPWSHHRDPLEALGLARAAGMKICVLEQTDESVPFSSLTREDFPLCIVVGNELTGVSPGILSRADLALEIPMFGVKHSLNAAVAYGIALFECVRVLRQDGGLTSPRRRPG
jgi:23S rRNA (guanosine2251-2'-O)-methyltransferase